MNLFKKWSSTGLGGRGEGVTLVIQLTVKDFKITNFCCTPTSLLAQPGHLLHILRKLCKSPNLNSSHALGNKPGLNSLTCDQAEKGEGEKERKKK